MTIHQTKRNTLILIIIVLALSWIVTYLSLAYQLKNSIDEQFQRMSASTATLFRLNLEHDRKTLDFELDRVVKAKNLPEAIANHDYEQIKSIVSPYYQQIKVTQSAVKILTFRSTEGVTLFRAHKPEFFGDTLNKKRKLIVDTNRLQRSFTGFEVGKLEMTYRVTKPIFYRNKYVGNVEIGMTPTDFIKNLSSIFKIDIGIAIDESLSSIMLSREMTPIGDKYLLIDANDNLKMHFSNQHDENSELYKVNMSIALENHISQKLGFLVVGYDISGIVKKDRAFMYRLFFIVGFMMFVLAFVLQQGFGRVLKCFTKQVYTDHLTGLKNLHALNDLLSSKQTHLLILSNIKEFSLINELYGVEIGDKILIQVAELFESFAKEHDCIAYRVSSDEFVLLKQEDIFDGDEYIGFINKLYSDINNLKILVDGVDELISVELYSGLAFNNLHPLEDAQMALKKAKSQLLPYLMYSQQVDTKQYSHIVMQAKRKIKYALENKNVIPFFQQITDADGKTIKYEALVRIVEYDNGKQTIMTPDMFLDISIKSGLYIKISQEMLEQSLAFFLEREEKVSVNFLPSDFFNSSIMATFMDCVKEFDSPERIVVEITEQDGVEDFDRLTAVVDKLRKLGVLIAIDDFGSGYANYAHILKIRPDYLKIDGSLVQNILTDLESQILVKSIVSFAQELNITTVAEYVENEDIFELLKEYGVDEYQGYYFGRPADLING